MTAHLDAWLATLADGPPLLLLLGLALATLVTEDGACLAAGLLVQAGRIELLPAAAACAAGIAAGDLGLLAAGRLAGRGLLARVARRARGRRALRAFRRNETAALAVARAWPGLRLPTFVAAGALGRSAARTALVLVVLAALWAPLLVAAGGGLAAGLPPGAPAWLAGALLVLLALHGGRRALARLVPWRWRRRAAGLRLRLARWEFWPAWRIYPPVVLHVLRLALRHRSLLLPTAANPGIPTGGLLGESKASILAAFGDEPRVARWRLLRVSWTAAGREAAAIDFVARHGLEAPFVLKPDVGERGLGVRILASEDELRAAARELRVDSLVQEHVGGVELGVAWARRPDDPAGRGAVLGITRKVLPSVTGDGRRTVEELVLADPRAVALHAAYRRSAERPFDSVPAAGERVSLAHLGTHALGAIFQDASRLATPALAATLDELGARFPGFSLGRYDVRASSEEAFLRGELRVLELNGLSAEPTHVYDAATSLREGRRALRAWWTLAFELGRANVVRGARPATLRELARGWRRWRRRGAGERPPRRRSRTTASWTSWLTDRTCRSGSGTPGGSGSGSGAPCP